MSQDSLGPNQTPCSETAKVISVYSLTALRWGDRWNTLPGSPGCELPVGRHEAERLSDPHPTHDLFLQTEAQKLHNNKIEL